MTKKIIFIALAVMAMLSACQTSKTASSEYYHDYVDDGKHTHPSGIEPTVKKVEESKPDEVATQFKNTGNCALRDSDDYITSFATIYGSVFRIDALQLGGFDQAVNRIKRKIKQKYIAIFWDYSSITGSDDQMSIESDLEAAGESFAQGILNRLEDVCYDVSEVVNDKVFVSTGIRMKVEFIEKQVIDDLNAGKVKGVKLNKEKAMAKLHEKEAKENEQN